jgi:hypothetical protein
LERKVRSVLIPMGKFFLALILGCSVTAAQAPLRLPDSPKFGYGARLDLWGQQINPAVSAAAGMGLDWIAIDFDWGRFWAEENVLPDLTIMHQVIGAALRGNLHVLMSITNAPTWASTPNGPDPNLTAGLVLSLYRSFPETLLAVELFPGANKASGWGTLPDPAAYAAMLKTTHRVLQKSGANVVIVAGGLSPLGSEKAAGDIEDTVYLESLYKLETAAYMPVIGLRLMDLTGDPMAAPDNGEGHYLRHYEQLRKIMLQNKHQSGLIWVTGFSWPEDPDQVGSQASINENEQAQWLNQAYRLLRSQLYIGTAFFHQLNPSDPAERGANMVGYITGHSHSLILADASLHLACNIISQLTAVNMNIRTVVFEGSISKKTPLKLVMKPSGP